MADITVLEDQRDHSQRYEELLSHIAKDDHVFIVLDDDPTGTQTVHDINVYTDWSYETMKQAMENDKLFYILTNSRGMIEQESRKIHEQIMETISKVFKETNKKYFYISRGDSTLRGHYPLETDLLAEGLKKDFGKVDGDILIPFFKEGGRFTLDDVHYVRYGDRLVPCAETEFAKDKTFGYHSSNLKEYIEEKSEGRIKKEEVLSIGLDDLRNERIEEIEKNLLSAHDQTKIIVNAADYSDVKIFCLALYKAIEKGKIFVFRSAASFVKCVGGIGDQPLLEKKDMILEENPNGGIVVVGSHTDKTTKQLKALLETGKVTASELKCSRILEGKGAFDEEVKRCTRFAQELIAQGRTAVVFTERIEIALADDDKNKALQRSVAISEGVWHIVHDLEVKPSFVVAKGGITSADVGAKGLSIKKAKVLGQIMPGIPVWQAEESSRFPGIPYIIFPGNVGEEDTLKKAVEKLI
ncbi:MAG: hypothetical protein K5648_00800 [Erysipelotrichaceae bacterium]|nr:hypothetical protein [Erysipelotrichaceae bacterium]